jgi:hypothetical protein
MPDPQDETKPAEAQTERLQEFQDRILAHQTALRSQNKKKGKRIRTSDAEKRRLARLAKGGPTRKNQKPPPAKFLAARLGWGSPLPDEKRCKATAIRTGQRCTRIRFSESAFCWHHTPSRLKRELLQKHFKVEVQPVVQNRLRSDVAFGRIKLPAEAFRTDLMRAWCVFRATTKHPAPTNKIDPDLDLTDEERWLISRRAYQPSSPELPAPSKEELHKRSKGRKWFHAKTEDILRAWFLYEAGDFDEWFRLTEEARKLGFFETDLWWPK